MNYTKGKWTVSPLKLGVLADDDDAKVVADCTNMDSLEECTTNAQLISAAPDMYEALKAVQRMQDWGEAVNKALAKAEGR